MKHILTYSLLLWLPAFFTPVKAEVIVEGLTITGSVSWTDANGPYRILGDVTIEPGGTLEIGSGCEVIFEGNYEIYVEGTLTANGARFYGKDLSGGLNVLWKGIRANKSPAVVSLFLSQVKHARIGLDLRLVDSLSGNPDITLDRTLFENNQQAIVNPGMELTYSIYLCTFRNNDVAIEGENPYAKNFARPSLSFCRFEGNGVAVRHIEAPVYACSFDENDTAISDCPYSDVDSSRFYKNGVGIRNHSTHIAHCEFIENTLAVELTDRDPVRLGNMKNAEVVQCVFRQNETGLFIHGQALFSLLECCFFEYNTHALIAPARIASFQDYRMERNIFRHNVTAFEMQEENPSPNPITGGSWLAQIRFNVLISNTTILQNRAPNDLNFFRNYMNLSQASIESQLYDGSDSGQYGLVNYTVSADTAIGDTNVVVSKLNDVIKHFNSIDSADTVSNYYQFQLCIFVNYPPLAVPRVEDEKSSVFPNPFTQRIQVKCREENPVMHLYSISGREIAIHYESTGDKEYFIDPGELPPGFYILRIEYDGSWESHKLQKLPY